MRPLTALTPGAEFRDYILQRPIEAASAEADLWVLAQRETGDAAVLKLYRYGIQPKREILEAIHQLQHASVVRVFESGVLDGRSFEIQEFIVHGSLASVVGDGPLPPEELLALLRELADAIAEIHAAGIIHRDLKPSNILVRSREPLDLVLADFGISSLSDLSLHLSNVSRTAAYVAPALLRRVVAEEKPEYLEVVELVAADRLHFRTAAQCATAERMRERFGRTGCIVSWGGTNGYPGPGEAPPVCGQSIVSIAAGAFHTLALRDDGMVVAWGSNVAADGFAAGQARGPTELADVLALAAGTNHSLALVAASEDADGG